MSEIDYTETCRRDTGKTPGATGLVRINYKEDFELVVELLADGKPYPLADEDFRIDFTVMASRYSVGREGGACERCAVVGGNKVRCFMDGHGLPPGKLRAEVRVDTPDANYADGKRLSVAVAEGDVELVDGNTRLDGATVRASLPIFLVDAYQLAKERGYKGTMDEYYATFTDISALLAKARDMAKAERERQEAERARQEAETAREAEADKARAAWRDIERMRHLREGEYARELELVEKIRNAPKEPTQDVWLDATDGEVKSGPAEGNLTGRALKYYHLGRRVVRGDFHGASKEGDWQGNLHVRHLDASGWDMTMCTDAQGKFYRWTSLRTLDTSGWNLSALTIASSMFSGCGSLQTIDASKWNLSALTIASSMFSGCGSLQTIDASKWNLSALTNGSEMFRACGSLQTLDTSGWNLSALTNAGLMFYDCLSLRRLDLRKSEFRSVAYFDMAFNNCRSLAELWLPLTFDKLASLALGYIPSWGSTPEGLASLRWTFGDGADDRAAKGLRPCAVRLDASVYDRLTDEERTAAAKKGWTITK